MIKKIVYIICLLSAIFYSPIAAFGQFLFQDVTDTAGIYMRASGNTQAGSGVMIFDLDGDGWDDIYMAGGLDSDKLYLNMHDGTFKNVAPLNVATRNCRSIPRGGIAFDYDNDGNPDLYLVCENRDILWHNNGDGTFTDMTRKAQLNFPLDQNESISATFGDFNGDGLNDFYVARWVHILEWPYIGWPNWFYVNNGDGTFTDRAKEFGVDNDSSITNIALFFDYDRDGDLDLLIGNDYGNLYPNKVYKNMLMETGTATFVDVSKEAQMQIRLSCMGIGPCDYNRDGQFDFFETTQGADYLMKNNGNGTFDSVSKIVLPPGEGFERSGSGVRTTSWTALMGDYDNDGWEDGFIVHGYLFEPHAEINPSDLDTSIFFHNVGGLLKDYTDQAMNGKYFYTKGRGGAFFDFNHDGKLDLCFGGLANDGFTYASQFRLLQNVTPATANPAHWLEMRFTAKRTAKEGIGTTVDVWAGGIVRSRQVSTGGGYGSQNSLMQHVGLGKYGIADSIIIYWPCDKHRNRTINRYYNVAADQIILYTEDTSNGNGLRAFVSAPASDQINMYPSPVRNVLNIENLGASGAKRFEVYDLLGVRVIDITISESAFSLPVGSLNAGCYTLRITTKGNTITKQFIKE